MLSFAIGWELWLRTHEAFALGMVGLVQVVPVILLSLPAGHIADHYNRKRIVLLSELFLALCVLGLGWLSYTEGPLVLIYGLLLGIGIARALNDPASSTLLPADGKRQHLVAERCQKTSCEQQSKIPVPEGGIRVVTFLIL